MFICSLESEMKVDRSIIMRILYMKNSDVCYTHFGYSYEIFFEGKRK